MREKTQIGVGRGRKGEGANRAVRGVGPGGARVEAASGCPTSLYCLTSRRGSAARGCGLTGPRGRWVPPLSSGSIFYLPLGGRGGVVWCGVAGWLPRALGPVAWSSGGLALRWDRVMPPDPGAPCAPLLRVIRTIGCVQHLHATMPIKVCVDPRLRRCWDATGSEEESEGPHQDPRCGRTPSWTQKKKVRR
jgi:hypothetical protein